MVNYVLLTVENTVQEIIPDIDPVFPGVPIEDRYTPDFVARLIRVPDSVAVEQNWLYDPETGEFSEPVEEAALSAPPMISEASSSDNLPADTSA